MGREAPVVKDERLAPRAFGRATPPLPGRYSRQPGPAESGEMAGWIIIVVSNKGNPEGHPDTGPARDKITPCLIPQRAKFGKTASGGRPGPDDRGR